MATVGNNESGKIEQFVIEELYSKGDEMALLKRLLQISRYRDIIEKLSRLDAAKLYKEAKKMIDDATTGKVSAEDMAATQRKIVCYLAAIDDRYLVKILEKVADKDVWEDVCENKM